MAEIPWWERSEVNGQTSVDSSNTSTLHWMYREEHLWTHNASNFEVSYIRRRSRQVSLLSDKKKKLRLQFALVQNIWQEKIGKKKIFALSDESRVLLRHLDGRGKQHESMNPSCISSMVQTVTSGCMGNISLVYTGTVSTTNKITFKCLSVVAASIYDIFWWPIPAR